MIETFLLDRYWVFKETNGQRVPEWLTVERVPTNVHLDLLHHKVIKNPFLDYNELECRWVAETDWTYGRVLPPLRKRSDMTKIVLAFDGLDTFCEVLLNGKLIFQSNDMFIPYRVEISDHFRFGEQNWLDLNFKSAFKEARKLKSQFPEHKWCVFNGEEARLAARKAQYHWGWDWGPILSPCGPWREVRIEVYEARLYNLRADYQVSRDLKDVSGSISAFVENADSAATTEVTFEICEILREGKLHKVFNQTVVIEPECMAHTEFTLKNANLWYPYGYGAQPLYKVFATATIRGYPLTTSITTGFRCVVLVKQPDLKPFGESFFFNVNSIDVFCGGSNWIPADCFTPRTTPETYEKWLQAVVDGNQSMIRVWGGGIYEDDEFYDVCDKLGILVWQDFMFSCGAYPVFPDINDAIETEAVENVRRLRRHPSIVIYAGNNEDYQVQEQFGLEYNWEEKAPYKWLKTTFPARYYYECLLPNVIRVESSGTPYHPGSPFSEGTPTTDQTRGDLHQWQVWHGDMKKYQNYDKLSGRFVSEFGMESYPHISTIRAFCSDPNQLYPQSRTIDFHNKASGHTLRLARYMADNFRNVTGLEAYVHVSQLVQSEALAFAFQSFRRQWIALHGVPSGKENGSTIQVCRPVGGALVWQLNDVWPGISWSIIDHFHRKKPAWYTIRRALASLTVGIQRDLKDWDWEDRTRVSPEQFEWKAWICNGGIDVLPEHQLEVRAIGVDSGKVMWSKLYSTLIHPNATTNVATGTVVGWTGEGEQCVLQALLLEDKKLVARDCDWPQPLKWLGFENRGLVVETGRKAESEDNVEMRVKAEKPVKGLVFEERDGVWLQDSALDVMPGDKQTVLVKGLKEGDKPLGWRYLGMEESSCDSV